MALLCQGKFRAFGALKDRSQNQALLNKEVPYSEKGVLT
jgi:hypothetical protein